MSENLTKEKYDVIVIGAGAAGMMTMHDLLNAGFSVCLLEAGFKPGGRIATVIEKGFDKPVETGAEFVHGELPLTLKLLNQAGIHYEAINNKMLTLNNGNSENDHEHDKNWEKFMRQVYKLNKDMTIAGFMDEYFPSPQYDRLRADVKRFSEGFDLADINHASILSARDEWSHEEDVQYRIPGGYSQLINYLDKVCLGMHGVIHFNTQVKKIIHEKNDVTIEAVNGKRLHAAKVVVTASVGVLQSNNIEFLPVLRNHRHAISKLGFGTNIKVLLQFKTQFWKDHGDDIIFFLSDEQFGAWSTQLPEQSNILTGWLGGPDAVIKSSESDEIILTQSLQSLSSMFKLTLEKLREELVHHKIVCWHNNPNTKGAYSYNTIDSTMAKVVLAEPFNDTIYFAGEGVYAGQSQGTVEAALQSGADAAVRIITAGK